MLHVSAAWLLRRCIRQGTHARGSMRAHQIRVKSCFRAIRAALAGTSSQAWRTRRRPGAGAGAKELVENYYFSLDKRYIAGVQCAALRGWFPFSKFGGVFLRGSCTNAAGDLILLAWSSPHSLVLAAPLARLAVKMVIPRNEFTIFQRWGKI